jgi:hypothetical protein
MTRLLQDDIRLRNRAGLSGTGVDDSPGVGPAPPAEVSPIASSPRVASIAKVVDLDAAYERYKQGKGFGRSDLFGVIIAEIKELKQRIGSVDEARVAELDGRMSALERTLGNALRPVAPNGLPDTPGAPPEKRGPGRPKREEQADG